MEVIQLDRKEDLRQAAVRAAEVLRAGGVVLYPTDTLYGLGVAAFSNTAVDMIYQIKGRDDKKPIHAIVADVATAEQYAVMNDAARRLAERFWPGTLTLVLKKKEGIGSGICRDMDTIGIRIPNNEFCLTLAREFGKPFTTTSANIAGQSPERSVAKILKQLGSDPYSSILQNTAIDLAVDAGELPESKPSTIVDLSTDTPKILREGAIPTSEIRAILGD